MNKMKASEITEILEQRRKGYDACNVEDALASPVNTERFYRFVSSIADISVDARGDAVEVSYDEPVPGATNLDGGYTYTVEVGREGSYIEGHTRCEMPKAELLTLQQVTIVIWSLATGEVY